MFVKVLMFIAMMRTSEGRIEMGKSAGDADRGMSGWVKGRGGRRWRVRKMKEGGGSGKLSGY